MHCTVQDRVAPGHGGLDPHSLLEALCELCNRKQDTADPFNTQQHFSFLSSHSIVQAIEAADEFFSACSSDVSDDNERIYDVSPPYEPFVGS
jgi:hypothetical protein